MHPGATFRRAATGAVSGVAATAAMDAVGTVFWERAMDDTSKDRERAVEPKFPLEVLAGRISQRLGLAPDGNASRVIGSALHWSIGAACGALHGMLEERMPAERRMLAQPVAIGMLAVDEFGFSAAGLAPWPKAFPWQTHARAAIAHVTYGIALSAVYESLKFCGAHTRTLRGGSVLRNGIFDWFIELIQDSNVLDGAAHLLQPAVKSVFSSVPEGQRVRQALHGTWLGHALHPVLTDLPIGAWTMAAVFDAVGTRDSSAARAADICVAAGVVTAVPTAITGLNDWSEIFGRPARVGVAHALCNVAATTLYAGSLIARRSNRALGVQLAYCGFGVMMLGGVLGGHLVFAQQIGVNRSAGQGLPTGFVAVMPEADLKPDTPTKAAARGKQLVLVKSGGRIFAMSAVCSHLGGPLAKGTLEDGGLRCPWHGSVFALEDGRVLNSPATIAQTCYETRVRDGQIEVRAANSELP
jgi:nitrite reductase/ring-hydroxylating ferredoxin subunit/uncharacterized membrane protein